MSKKLTANQQEYKKQINRINRFYKNAELRGYRFTEKIPLDIPNRVTKKSLERIQSIKPKHLYEQAEYLDPTTGKIVSGTEGRRIERRNAYYNSTFNKQAVKDFTPDYSPPSVIEEVLYNTEYIMNSVDSKIEEWSKPKNTWTEEFKEIKVKDRDMFETMLEGARAQLGDHIVALNIEKNATEFNRELEALLYGTSGDKKDGIQPNLIALHRILYQQSPDVEQMADYLDRHEKGVAEAHQIVLGVKPSSNYDYEESFE